MGFTLKNKFQTQSGFLNLNVSSNPTFTISYIVVGGGGGAGNNYTYDQASGGGAGGFLTGSLNWASGITFVATRGLYGAVGLNDDIFSYAGSNGGNSSLVYSGNTILAYGGGGGGSGNFNGGNGGSGGGSGSIGSAPTGVIGQGNNGGVMNNGTGEGAGGGGAGSIGGDPFYDPNTDTDYSGIGGIGLASSITGSSIIYSVGGSGVGSNANPSNPPFWGNAGSGGNLQSTGQGNVLGNGFNGVVIISIPSTKYTGLITGSPSVTTDGSGNKILTWNGLSGTYIS